MTRAEALLEAHSRYGHGAWVATNEEGRYQIGRLDTSSPGYRMFIVRGEAWQGWEEAFDNADARDLEE